MHKSKTYLCLSSILPVLACCSASQCLVCSYANEAHSGLRDNYFGALFVMVIFRLAAMSQYFVACVILVTNYYLILLSPHVSIHSQVHMLCQMTEY